LPQSIAATELSKKVMNFKTCALAANLLFIVGVGITACSDPAASSGAPSGITTNNVQVARDIYKADGGDASKVTPEQHTKIDQAFGKHVEVKGLFDALSGKALGITPPKK
jgi:hypothetical protein